MELQAKQLIWNEDLLSFVWEVLLFLFRFERQLSNSQYNINAYHHTI